MRALRLGIFLGSLALAGETELPPARPDSSLTNRAAIAIVRHSEASVAFSPSLPAVQRLVEATLATQSADGTGASAWRKWLGKKDLVGFKVTSGPGPTAGTRPVLIQALVESLLASGHPPGRIIIWDRRKSDLIESGFDRLATSMGVRCVGVDEADWDASKFYESPVPGRLVFGDLEFSRRPPLLSGGGGTVGRRSHVSRLLTQELTKVITVAPLLNHNLIGVHGHIGSLGLGSVDNTFRFEDSEARMAEALPEIVALDEIFPKLAVCFTDALWCQYRGEERTLLHYTETLNELWVSVDPVALDVLAVREMNAARQRAPVEGEKPFKTELYKNCELLELGIADEKRFDVRRSP